MLGDVNAGNNQILIWKGRKLCIVMTAKNTTWSMSNIKGAIVGYLYRVTIILGRKLNIVLCVKFQE